MYAWKLGGLPENRYLCLFFECQAEHPYAFTGSSSGTYMSSTALAQLHVKDKTINDITIMY